MNHKLELMDQFDDAAFALMMDEYAEAEGERLRAEFEEAMRSGATPECPPELDEKCRKQITRHFGRQRRTEYARAAKRIAGRAIACLLIALGISAALVMSVEALRVPFWKYIRNDYGTEQDFDINFIDQTENNDWKPIQEEDPILYLVPEGYHRVHFEKDKGRIIARYETDDGRYIAFDMYYTTAFGSEIAEDENHQYIALLNKKAVLDRSSVFAMSWEAPEIETKYRVSTNGLSETELIEFCEEIIRFLDKAYIDIPTEVPDALEDMLPDDYEQYYSETLSGLLACSYGVGEKLACFNMHESGNLTTTVIDPVITETAVADYDATHMVGTDEIGTLWYDEERNLVFYFYTRYMPEQDHLALCEYLAEYYKGVTLPAVSTVLWE